MIEIIDLVVPVEQEIGPLVKLKYNAYADVAPGIRFWRLVPETERHNKETWYFGAGKEINFRTVGIAAVITDYGEGSSIESFTGWRLSTALGSPGRPKRDSLQECFEKAPEAIRKAAWDKWLETNAMLSVAQEILTSVGPPHTTESQ